MKISPLRQKFIEDLTIKGYSPRTIVSYVCAVAKLARHYALPPDQLSDEQVRSFLYHLHTEADYSWSTLNVTVNALRCFFKEVVHRPLGQIDFAVPHLRKSVRRPQAYSVEEVHTLLDHGFTSPKHRIFFMTLYGTGLRLSEGCHLQVKDIDSKRMLVRVDQGKGRKDRYSILPQHLLNELRGYYRLYHPTLWLFPGRLQPLRPMTSRGIQAAFKKALERVGLPIKGGPHTLRHSFATHLIEANVPLHVVKRLMGHASFVTTAGYLHISKQALENVVNPLDSMPWANGPAL